MGCLPTVKVRVKDELSTLVEVNICTHVQCVKYIITSQVRVLMFMNVNLRPGGGEAARLLDDEGHGHALVQEPQLAPGRRAGPRVHEDPAVLGSGDVLSNTYNLEQ